MHMKSADREISQGARRSTSTEALISDGFMNPNGDLTEKTLREIQEVRMGGMWSVKSMKMAPPNQFQYIDHRYPLEQPYHTRSAKANEAIFSGLMMDADKAWNISYVPHTHRSVVDGLIISYGTSRDDGEPLLTVCDNSVLVTAYSQLLETGSAPLGETSKTSVINRLSGKDKLKGAVTVAMGGVAMGAPLNIFYGHPVALSAGLITSAILGGVTYARQKPIWPGMHASEAFYKLSSVDRFKHGVDTLHQAIEDSSYTVRHHNNPIFEHVLNDAEKVGVHLANDMPTVIYVLLTQEGYDAGEIWPHVKLALERQHESVENTENNIQRIRSALSRQSMTTTIELGAMWNETRALLASRAGWRAAWTDLASELEPIRSRIKNEKLVERVLQGYEDVMSSGTGPIYLEIIKIIDINSSVSDEFVLDACKWTIEFAQLFDKNTSLVKTYRAFYKKYGKKLGTVTPEDFARQHPATIRTLEDLM